MAQSKYGHMVSLGINSNMPYNMKTKTHHTLGWIIFILSVGTYSVGAAANTYESDARYEAQYNNLRQELLQSMRTLEGDLNSIQTILVANQTIIEGVLEPPGGVGGPGPDLTPEQVTVKIEELNRKVEGFESRLDSVTSTRTLRGWMQRSNKTLEKMNVTFAKIRRIEKLIFDDIEAAVTLPTLRTNVKSNKENLEKIEVATDKINTRITGLYNWIFTILVAIAGAAIGVPAFLLSRFRLSPKRKRKK